MSPLRGVVTISSTYGAGGAIVGPALAERLDLPFVDRAIPAGVAQRMAVSLESALAHDERTESGVERILSSMARMVAPVGPDPDLAGHIHSAENFRQETETVLHHIADTTGGVILGRAGMVVLGRRPDVLCVRLDGPVEARIAQAVRLEHMDERQARERRVQTDRARDAYIRTLYGVRQEDPRLYHLILDSTVLDLDTCVDLAERAARVRLPASDPRPTKLT